MKKLLVLILLIPSIVIAQSAIEPTYKTLSTVAFGSVTASYTAFLSNSVALFDLDILNLTDQPITCSFDSGTTDHVVIPAYSSYSPKLGRSEAYLDNPVQCKRTSSAPTVGSVYISGAY